LGNGDLLVRGRFNEKSPGLPETPEYKRKPA
jgi:hypothetical protein